MLGAVAVLCDLGGAVCVYSGEFCMWPMVDLPGLGLGIYKKSQTKSSASSG